MVNAKNFSLKNYDEVQLKSNPLLVVIGQVSFEAILSVNDQSSLAKFQKIISELYPVFKADTAEFHNVDLVTKSLTSVPQQIWRFLDKDEIWRVTLTTDAISLESFKYVSRVDFQHRFEFLIEAFQKNFQPKLVNRIGVRYVNRFTGDAFEKVSTLINSSLLTVYTSELINFLSSTISEAFFNIDKKTLLGRWGLIPPSSTIDPNIVQPIDSQSWILDIDSSNSHRVEWSNKLIQNEFKDLTILNYNFFRWATTSELLNHYGVKK